MPSPVILLYRALIEEYESQKIQPPFPRDEFEQRRQAYEEKLAALRQADPSPAEDREECDRQTLDAELVRDFYTWLHKNGVRRSALCFSGGGIRSATFGLGLVQGLARHGLLGKFDFLSTVSGGGYLGSWLTGWIYRERQRLGTPELAVESVESQLRSLPLSPLQPEPEPVRYLRSYSRYMSPKVGLLSADTWTLIGIFLRNLFLNWLVLLPLLAAALVIPRVSVLMVRMATTGWFQRHEGWILPVVFGVALLLGAMAIAYIGVNRSSLETHSTFPRHLRSQGWFVLLCLLPISLMAILMTLYWAWVRSSGVPLDRLRFVLFNWPISPVWSFILFGVLLHLGGFLLSRIWVSRYAPGELAVVVLTGALGGGAAWLAISRLFPDVRTPLVSELYVCFAAPLVLFLFLLAATLFVGLSSYYTNDADREWLARAGAWMLIAIVVRSVFSAIVIFGPVALMKFVLLVPSIGGVSGLLTLVLGRSSKTRAKKRQSQGPEEKKTSPVLDLVLTLAAPIFAAFVLISLSLGTTLLVEWLTNTFSAGHDWHPRPGPAAELWRLINVVYYSPWWAVIAVLAALALLGAIMGWFVDINRFSLHAAYRNRLIRAYLGASRGEARRPNPFTGFDEDDNIEMRKIRGNRPFHVVNMALNLVAGQNLAWQDRKAETFTASPLHAGSYRLGYRDVAEYGLHRNGQNALSLGTSLAISGAAASPNMGYHSSPVVTFLLALFNVRLGWWLGNPGKAGDRTFATPGPRFAPRPLFDEAFGFTDNQHPYVYLSDGGHFENLALYEMILRRCHFIVVSDGGQDPEFNFEDLGNAVSKIRVDLGVPIKFEKILMRPRQPGQETYDTTRNREAAHSTQPYCAIARICYSCVDSVRDGKVADGLLLYVKPSLNGTEPTDVFHYARLHPQFPHEPTSDQLYSESQFESYRELGFHTMRTILEGMPAAATLEELFQKVERELGKPPDCA